MVFEKQIVGAIASKAFKKSDARSDIESAFMFKDFLSYQTILRWVYVGLTVMSYYWIIPFLTDHGLISNWTGALIEYMLSLLAFIFINYLILYMSIKIYRGFKNYIIPFIKAMNDVPFRLHQKLLED